MNPSRFFIPNMMVNPAMVRSTYMMPKNMGLLSRITGGIRSFNWSKLLSGANKTLNVMNQTIPLIKQTKPMIGNVKSMLQLAKAFRSETGNKHYMSDKITSTRKINNNDSSNDSNNDYPTFFI